MNPAEKRSNIVLIGMPGVGKSTIGVILAKVLGYEFTDCDLVIQAKEKRLLHEIISDVGPEGFIEVENRILAGLEVEHSVIATGGSAVYGEAAMAHLGSIGTVVYLKQSLDELRTRLSDIKNRGVVLKDGQTLDDLYAERSVLYEKYADIIIDEQGRGIEETLHVLVETLFAYFT